MAQTWFDDKLWWFEPINLGTISTATMGPTKRSPTQVLVVNKSLRPFFRKTSRNFRCGCPPPRGLEAGQIYGRLYEEAQLRRKRREDLAREAEDKALPGEVNGFWMGETLKNGQCSKPLLMIIGDSIIQYIRDYNHPIGESL